eukprot:gb/GFBE01072440.1/.p1 GENE.gb/GFBE01072440.1/~~gb/GFBE01072440.1/.p1  ORF type:complete len:233 (+),score=70.88 gb/GFBE01072440.1/:1-699(+)
MFTLFAAISGGIDWEVATRQLSRVHEMYLTIFVFYVFFMVFAVLNIVTGLFCQNALETAQHDADSVILEHLNAKESYVRNLRLIFETIDGSSKGLITLHDMETVLASEDVRLKTYLEALDLQVDDAWNLFKLLDRQDTNAVTIENFVEGCLRLKGQAKSIDLARMMYENKWMMTKLSKLTKDLRVHQTKAVESRQRFEHLLLLLLKQAGASETGVKQDKGSLRREKSDPIHL